MARPTVEITADLLKKVEALAAQGLTNDQIAYSIGHAPSTLYAKKKMNSELSEAISRGKAKGIATLTNSLFNKAKSGDIGAIKYFLNNRDRENWQERPENNQFNDDAPPLSIHFTVKQAVSEIKVTNA